MRILIDIGHPGHVHYFRNLIQLMEPKGHLFQIVARDKEVAFKLLDHYKLPYQTRGKGGKGIIGKLIYILIADLKILRIALKFKPDLFLSFSSTYAGHVAFLVRKSHIVFDDTEHARFEHIMYKPFAKAIITPSCFYKPMGKKHILFDGYMEMCYLHENYFKPNHEVLEHLNVTNEKYVIVRFVSWTASHDIGYHGFDHNAKMLLVNELIKYARVIISSESELPKELESYRMSIPPEMLHNALFYAALYIGEGGTTASEASILGIPSIYVNTLPLMGYLKDEEQAGLLFHLSDSKQIINKAVEIISDPGSTEKYKLYCSKLLKDKIDVTAFMVWFIENYPRSVRIMRENPDYQFRFK